MNKRSICTLVVAVTLLLALLNVPAASAAPPVPQDVAPRLPAAIAGPILWDQPVCSIGAPVPEPVWTWAGDLDYANTFAAEGQITAASCISETVLREDFEVWPLANWTVFHNQYDCDWDSNEMWPRRDNYAGGDGQCADADSNRCNGPMDAEMWSPPIDLRGATEASLDFIAAYDHTSKSRYFEVNVSPDGGTNWETVLQWAEDHSVNGPGEPVTLDLTRYVGNEQVIVSFHYLTDDKAHYAEVDQVQIDSCFLPSLVVTPTNQASLGCLGSDVTYSIDVSNRSRATRDFDVSLSSNTWPTTVSPESFTLEHGITQTLELTVTVPPYLFEGVSDTVTIDVYSLGDPELAAQAFITTTAGGELCPPQDMALLQGVVTNGVSGEPIQGALVQVTASGPSISGGTPFVYTEEDGTYSLSLYYPASYDLRASYGTFDPATAHVVLPAEGATQDFLLGPPVASPVPAEFSQTVAWGEVAQQSMAVGNAGYSLLDFTLAEKDGDITWLTEAPLSGNVLPSSSEPVLLTFDASVVAGMGTYTGTLVLQSNDPASPTIELPVEMIVVDNPAGGKLQGIVTTDRPGGPLQGATVDVEGPSGLIASLTTGADGSYEQSFLPADLPLVVTVTASFADYQAAQATATIESGEVATLDLMLTRLAPWIYVHPPALELTIPTDYSQTLSLNVDNEGLSDLIVPLIQEIPATATLPLEADPSSTGRAVVAMDIPWLSLSPESGTIPPGGTMPVTVTFDSTALEPDIYTGTLQVLHNDPLEGEVLVPVTLTVRPYVPDLYLTKTVEPKEQEPGGVVTYTIVMENRGEPASNAVLSDTLPAEVVYAWSDPPGTLLPGDGGLVWGPLDLDEGARITTTVVVTIGAEVPDGTPLTNTAYLIWGETKLMDQVEHSVRQKAITYYLYLPTICKNH